MKTMHLALLVSLFAATILPETKTHASPAAPAPPDLAAVDHAQHVTPDFDLALDVAAYQLRILAGDGDDAPAAEFQLAGDDAPAIQLLLMRGDDAPRAPAPQVTILTRRELSRLLRANWLSIDRVADPTAV